MTGELRGGVRKCSVIAAVVIAAAAVWFAAGFGIRRAGGAMPSGPQAAPAFKTQRAAAPARQAVSKLPLSFEENRGQAGAGVQFVARGLGYAALLSRRGVLLGVERSAGVLPARAVERSRPAARSQSAALRVEWVGSSREASAQGLDRLAGASNYFIGNNPRRWMTGVPHFARVRYARVYPGVDLVYHGSAERLEYDFDVAPGANPAAIRLKLGAAGGRGTGAQPWALSLTPHGALRAQLSGGGGVEFLRPVAYQPVAGGAARKPVRASFRLLGGGQAGFALGPYDHSQPLVIDPTITFSTYLGGSNNDLATGVALDGNGNVYVAGSTFSANFPTAGGYQSSCASCASGTADAFLAKLSPDGKTLIYATFLGGSAEDDAYGVAVDSGGNAYLTGRTFSSNFPVAAPVQATCSSCLFNLADAFVAKIGPSGSTLAYSTFLGGLGEDDGIAIAVDAAGDAYITGRTNSTNYPVSSPYQGSLGGGFDAIVTELNPAGSSLVYSTYLGGGSEDDGYGIAVDSTGAAYVTGQTFSNNFPTTAGVVQATFGGGVDAFVAKLNAGGGGLAYSTYLGGTSTDSGHAIAVDSGGNAYVTGATNSSDFPLAGAAQGFLGGGGDDAFISKLGAKGAALVYSTFLGGNGADLGNGIAVDSAGKAYVTGVTSSSNLLLVNATQTTYNGNQDAFVAKATPTGCGFGFVTFFGGHATDIGNAIAVDGSGNPVVAGQTFSNDIVTQAPYQAATGGQLDGFAAKFTSLAGPVDCFAPQSLKFAGQTSASTSSPQNITFTNDGESSLTLTSISASGPFAETNTCGSSVNAGQNCTISVTFTPAAAGTANGVLTVNDNGPNSPHVLALTGTGLDFGLSGSPGSNTVAAGQSVVYTITVAPSAGFKDSVALTCTGAPAAATCALNPSSVTLDGTTSQTSTMTVTTTARSLALPRGQGNPPARGPGRGKGWWAAWLVLLAALAMAARLAAGAAGRRAAGIAALAAGLLLLAMAFASCGGTGKAFGGGTPPGTFTLTVTGADGNLTHSIRLGLTVQ